MISDKNPLGFFYSKFSYIWYIFETCPIIITWDILKNLKYLYPKMAASGREYGSPVTHRILWPLVTRNFGGLWPRNIQTLPDGIVYINHYSPPQSMFSITFSIAKEFVYLTKLVWPSLTRLLGWAYTYFAARGRQSSLWPEVARFYESQGIHIHGWMSLWFLHKFFWISFPAKDWEDGHTSHNSLSRCPCWLWV